MNVLQALAPFIASEAVIWSLVGFLIAWFLIAAIRLQLRTSPAIRALRKQTARLAQVPDAVAFAREYEAINEEMSGHGLLGPRWRDFSASLVLPRTPARPVRATVRPGQWFDLGLLQMPGVGLNLRLHNAMPNLLVGVGLLFTFLGLAVALSTAGAVVSGESADRNNALKTLLDTASFKFITSLVGLSLSIAYTVLLKRTLKSVERAIENFLIVLEARVPLVTPVALQDETNEILKRQADQLAEFNNELAINIGQRMDDVFGKRLGEHMGPLVDVMRRLADGMSSRNEEVLKEMLDGFVSRLQGGTGDAMREVVDSLSGFGDRLNGLQASLDDAAQRMAKSADVMSERLGQGADEAVSQLNRGMGDLAQTLQAIADQTRSAGVDATSKLVEGVQEASRSLDVTASRIAEAMERSAIETGGALGRGAEEAVMRIADATEGMRSQLQEMLAELRRSMREASEALQKGGEDGADAFRNSLGDAGGRSRELYGARPIDWNRPAPRREMRYGRAVPELAHKSRKRAAPSLVAQRLWPKR